MYRTWLVTFSTSFSSREGIKCGRSDESMVLGRLFIWFHVLQINWEERTSFYLSYLWSKDLWNKSLWCKYFKWVQTLYATLKGLQILTLVEPGVRTFETEEVYIENISGAKQFLCKQCVHHIAPKGFFVWALVYSLWWWGRCREYGPPEWKLPGSHRSDPATSSQTPSPIYFVRTTTPAVPDKKVSELRVRNQLSGFGLVGSLLRDWVSYAVRNGACVVTN